MGDRSDAPMTAEAAAPAVLSRSDTTLPTLKKRAEFLRAGRGRRQAMTGFVLQGIDRRDGDPAIRAGYTCSKKVGGAVARNRAKRRLREIARAILPRDGRPGWDYVLIGRRDTTGQMPFEALKGDLSRALERLHGGRA